MIKYLEKKIEDKGFVDIKKLTVSLVTTDIVNISRGKYTFFSIFPFSTIVKADLDIDVEKKVHGINPLHKKIR